VEWLALAVLAAVWRVLVALEEWRVAGAPVEVWRGRTWILNFRGMERTAKRSIK
jgi:hypothetical protein